MKMKRRRTHDGERHEQRNEKADDKDRHTRDYRPVRKREPFVPGDRSDIVRRTATGRARRPSVLRRLRRAPPQPLISDRQSAFMTMWPNIRWTSSHNCMSKERTQTELLAS